MIDQTQQRSTDAKDPVHDPYAEYVLLFFIEDTLKSRQNCRANHKQETKVDMQRGKDQRREEDRQHRRMVSRGDPPEVSLNDAACEKFLDPRGEDVQDLP